MSIKQQLPKIWQLIQRVSMIACPGSYIGLRYLVDPKEIAPWLDPKYVPFFGVPLLIIFLSSCVLGSVGLLNIIGTFYERYKQGNELIEKYRREEKESTPE